MFFLLFIVFLFGVGVVSVSLSSHFPGFVRPSGPSLAQTLALAFPTYPHRGGSCWKKGHQTQVGGKWGSWWLNQPHLKNMLVNMGSSSPGIGMKVKNL